MCSPELIERARAGDSVATQELFEHVARYFCPLIRDYCKKKGLPQDLHGDLLHEVLVLVMTRALKHYDSNKGVPFLVYARQWMQKAVQQCLKANYPQAFSLDKLEYEIYEKVLVDHGWISPDPADIVLEEEAVEVTRARVRRAMQELAPIAFTVLHKTFFEGKSSREIGEEMQLAPGSIRAIRSRAYRRLRELLENH